MMKRRETLNKKRRIETCIKLKQNIWNIASKWVKTSPDWSGALFRMGWKGMVGLTRIQFLTIFYNLSDVILKTYDNNKNDL